MQGAGFLNCIFCPATLFWGQNLPWSTRENASKKIAGNQWLNSLSGSISFCGYHLLYIRSAFVVTTCYIFVVEGPSPLKIARKKLWERKTMPYSATKPPAKLPLLGLCNYYLTMTLNKLSPPSHYLTCPTGHAVCPATYGYVATCSICLFTTSLFPVLKLNHLQKPE